MILNTYLSNQDILEFGKKNYPEIRFEYGEISKDNYTNYLIMIEKLRSLYIK